MTAADFFWKPAPRKSSSGDESIQVFAAPLDISSERLKQLGQTLSSDEHQRADRFHLQRDRQRFIVGRGTLREILGTLLAVEPECVTFFYGEFGKPRIAAPEMGRRLHFNVAHSDNLAVYAVAGSEIGIDIERLRPMADAEQIATRFFSVREAESLRTAPPECRLEAFFNCWTRKEAYLKAMGSGLSEQLKEIEVTLLPGEAARVLATPMNSPKTCSWHLEAISPAPGFCSALAYSQKPAALHCWTWI